MAGKLWDKGASQPSMLAQEAEAFTVGRDPAVDLHILEDDCLGSLAHGAALVRAGVLSPEEFHRIQGVLVAIASLAREGRFPIAQSQEDGHTAIEHRLIADLGETGKRIHTGRSRNDQVLTALRLYCRRRIIDMAQGLLTLTGRLLERARDHSRLPMRGYSHMQPAMPTTVGAFLASHAEALLDDARVLQGAYELNNQCPLGSAAGFGSVLNLDRDYTRQMLGFGRVQVNALYCQSSRGKVEGTILHALSCVQASLTRLATDLMLFTTREFGYLSLPDELTTGSSIMPQKRNPDVLELVRARLGEVHGAQTMVQSIASRLPSGYNRDYQLLKEPLILSFNSVAQSLAIMDRVVEGVTFHEEALVASCTKEIYAADVAMERAMGGVPFRDAYRMAMGELAGLCIDRAFIESRIDAYVTLGSMGNMGLEHYRAPMEELRRWVEGTAEAHRLAWEGLGG